MPDKKTGGSKTPSSPGSSNTKDLEPLEEHVVAPSAGEHASTSKSMKGVEQETETISDVDKGYWEKRKKQKKLKYNVTFFLEWCKCCGICGSLCPTKIILHDEAGSPYVQKMDNCIGCRFCEVHCPDFAIRVVERYPDRRKK